LFTEKAAAGLYSTAEDYAVFLNANIDGFRGNGILPRQSFEKMFTKINDIYGLGWGIVDLENGERVVEHAGANYGWKSYSAFIPERGDGIVILTNSDRGMSFYGDLANVWYKSKG
jgi:CubicO group peptidase (beta-lactamase class C family)